MEICNSRKRGDRLDMSNNLYDSEQRADACAFHIFHPVVPIAFFTLWICFTMVAFHPVYLLISFLGANALSLIYFGVKKTLAHMRWQLPFVVLIALVNPLFSAQGTTEICKIGALTVYSEALLFGAFMGVMFIDMMVCFSCVNRAVTHAGFMSVVARHFPTLALMVSMTARLIPNLRKKAKQIGDVQKACTSARVCNASSMRESSSDASMCEASGDVFTCAAASKSAAAGSAPLRDSSSNNSNFATRQQKAKQRKFNMRMITVLMGWSMEDSFVMADSMKIAGWKSERRRTTYSLYKIKRRDVMALVFIFALFALNVVFACFNCANFSFYPTMTPISFSFGYIDYAIFAFFPVILEVYENVCC